MLHPASYLATLCLLAILLTTLPCRAGEPGGKQPGIQVTANGYATTANTSPGFGNAFSSSQQGNTIDMQLLLPGRNYYTRDNPARTTLGRIMSVVGGLGTVAGSILIAGTDRKTASGLQRSTIGWITMGAGFGLFFGGFAVSGDQVPLFEHRPGLTSGRYGRY